MSIVAKKGNQMEVSVGLVGGSLPFELTKISAEEQHDRERIVRRFPGSFEGIALKGLADVLHVGEVRLFLDGIRKDPTNLPSDCVPVALTAGHTGRSGRRRMVLGLSHTLSDRLVNLTLGRGGPPEASESVFEERLLSGEKGALLFGLDTAGGDWIGAGGASFTVRGVLFDGDQIPDYLHSRPSVEVAGTVEGPGIRGRLWLWFNGEVPPTSISKPTIGANAGHWRTTFNVVAGYSCVSVKELERLELGDRIVLDGWNHPLGVGGGEPAVITSGKWRRFGRWLDNRRIEVNVKGERSEDMERSNDQGEMPVLLGPSEGDDDGDMAVTVSVEVGSFTASVEEASSLMPGRVLCLDREVGPDVALKVQGKLIGRGVLVDHEGLMAVEIKEVTS